MTYTFNPCRPTSGTRHAIADAG